MDFEKPFLYKFLYMLLGVGNQINELNLQFPLMDIILLKLKDTLKIEVKKIKCMSSLVMIEKI